MHMTGPTIKRPGGRGLGALGQKFDSMDDRTVNRWIKQLAVLLMVAIPLFAGFYYLDRHVDAGPSLPDRTVTAAEASVRANPNVLAKRIDLAAAYLGANRPNDALAQLNAVLKVQAQNRAALLGRGQTYLALGQLDAAAADYKTVIDMSKRGEMAANDPQLELAYYSYGNILLRQSRATEAVTALRSAASINPSDADALQSLGTAYIASGDASAGIAVLRQAVAYVPTGWCEPYSQLGSGYAALKDPAGQAWAGGMLALCQNQPDAALDKLQPLTTGPMKIDALIGLGLTAEAMGDPAKAAAEYRQVLALQADNFLATTGLSRVLDPGQQPSASPSPVGSN